jgi:hypothetical protein
MARDLIQHVIEKRHARIELLMTNAIEIERNANLRFVGIADDFRGTGCGHERIRKIYEASDAVSAAQNKLFSSGVPTVTLRQFSSNGCILPAFSAETRARPIYGLAPR